MNRTIKVIRTDDPLFSIRIEIYDIVSEIAASIAGPIAALNLTPQEASALDSILKLFSYNNSISSLTEKVATTKGGAS